MTADLGYGIFDFPETNTVINSLMLNVAEQNLIGLATGYALLEANHFVIRWPIFLLLDVLSKSATMLPTTKPNLQLLPALAASLTAN